MEKEQQIALILSAQKGDSDAINTLFSEVYNDIYYFALKTVKDSELACDITQEALIDIFNNITSLQDPVAFPAWSRQITYRQCTRHFRKKTDVLLDENEDGGSIFDTIEEENVEFIPDQLLDQKDFRKTVMNFIDTLSEEQRSAVLLYYFEERSIGEIAQIQNVSEGTVKSRLNYARKTIKALVEDYEQKNNIKLHALPFFPFIRWIFAPDKAANLLPTATVQSAASAVGASVGSSAAAATATSATAATTATSTATATAATAATVTAAKATAIPIITKIVAGIVAAGIVAGGATVATNIIKENKEPDNSKSVSQSEDDKPTSSDKRPEKVPSKAQRIKAVLNGVLYVLKKDADGNLLGWYATKLANPDDNNLKSLYIPAEIDDIPVIGIQEQLFYSDDSILSANIHCKEIPYGAFQESNLERLVIGSEVEKIERFAFAKCENLNNVTIESGDRTIEFNAFFNSAFYDDPENLKNDMLIVGDTVLKILPREKCVIPEGVTHIAEGAVTSGAIFESGNSNMWLGETATADSTGFQVKCSIIKELYLPSTLKNMRGYVFHSMVEEIHLSPENPYFHVANNCLIETATKTLVLGSRNGSIPSDGSVTIIGEYAFGGWEVIIEPFRIEIPDCIEEIRDGAFTTVNIRINKLPDSLRKIGNGVFSPATKFDDTTIPPHLTSIGETAFENTNIEYP